MKQQITMTVDTTAAHGGIYITATARALETHANHADDRVEAEYKAAIVMDIKGDVQVAWWTNADATFLGQNDGVPIDVVTAWRDQVRAIAMSEDNDALFDLADYIDRECCNDSTAENNIYLAGVQFGVSFDDWCMAANAEPA